MGFCGLFGGSCCVIMKYDVILKYISCEDIKKNLN